MPHKHVHHTIHASFVLSAAALVAAAAFAGAVYFRSSNSFAVEATRAADAAGEPRIDGAEYGSWPALANADFFARVKEEFLEERRSFVEADLTAMKVRVYEEGEVALEVPILTKGRPGSWWETPAGLYQVQSKAANHFSSFGHVYQPWSMAFQGNFFIHGWPYYPNGIPVSSSFSGGCVRLSTEDAKAVYDRTEVGMPVLVYEEAFAGDDFRYPAPAGGGAATLSGLSAKEYLAADLKNNYVFLAQGSTAQVPVASITKLMTALIATEYINLDSTTTVPAEAIMTTARPRLKAGERINAFQLLFPLLEESSNEAAYTLADYLGQKRFVNLMNEKAKALGMTGTHFTDPSGLDDGNVSTAEDLFALAKYLLNNRSFILKITADSLGDNAYGEPQFADLRNYNVFDGREDFIGGKVGSTPTAGRTMIALFDAEVAGETRAIAIATLGSTDVATDVRKILGYINSNY